MLSSKHSKIKITWMTEYLHGHIVYFNIVYVCAVTPLVLPVSSLEGDPHPVGTEKVLLSTCTAAGAKPPATVKLLTGALEGDVTIENGSTTHNDGTTTTVMSLLGVPTKRINQHLIQCVITSSDPYKEDTLSFKLQVQCKYNNWLINSSPILSKMVMMEMMLVVALVEERVVSLHFRVGERHVPVVCALHAN